MAAQSVVRLLHFADLHLGVEAGGRTDPSTGLNQRLVDVCTRLDEVCACVEAEGIDVVIFAGDAFKHQHPTTTWQRLFAQRIRRMARAGAAVFLLVGNHDLPKGAGLAHPFSIYEALEVEGVVIGDRAKVYRVPLSNAAVPEIQIAALPHFSKHQVLARIEADFDDPDEVIEEEVARTTRAFGSDVDRTLPAIFAGHCHVNQAEVGDAQALFGVSDVEVSLSTLVAGRPLPYYALGHVHKRQVLSEEPFVAYSGSLERIDFGEGARIEIKADGTATTKEAESKGFYRADLVYSDAGWELQDAPEFRTVSSRPFVTLRTPNLDTTDPFPDLARRVERARSESSFVGAFVRVHASLDAAGRGRVQLSAVRDLMPECYDVRLAIESLDRGSVRDPRFSHRMSEVQALDAYIESRADWSDDREALIALGRELIAEVDA